MPASRETTILAFKLRVNILQDKMAEDCGSTFDAQRDLREFDAIIAELKSAGISYQEIQCDEPELRALRKKIERYVVDAAFRDVQTLGKFVDRYRAGEDVLWPQPFFTYEMVSRHYIECATACNLWAVAFSPERRRAIDDVEEKCFVLEIIVAIKRVRTLLDKRGHVYNLSHALKALLRTMSAYEGRVVLRGRDRIMALEQFGITEGELWEWRLRVLRLLVEEARRDPNHKWLGGEITSLLNVGIPSDCLIYPVLFGTDWEELELIVKKDPRTQALVTAGGDK